MRGSRAKKLRKTAERVVIEILDESPGKGYNEYNQIENRLVMEQPIDKDGMPMTDPEGMPLIAPVPKPGTITCAWLLRIVYQRLKKEHKGQYVELLSGIRNALR